VDAEYLGDNIGDDWKLDFRIDGSSHQLVDAQGWTPGQDLSNLVQLPVLIGTADRAIAHCGSLIDLQNHPVVLRGEATELDSGGTDDFTVVLDGILTGISCPSELFGAFPLGRATVKEVGGEDGADGDEAEIKFYLGFSADCIST
jgi:hypothetical protein